MEVHHHAHTSRTKWTHYFWEFLMLFLAVTLGFFVENQREHYIENQRERQYIKSFIEDLRSDTSAVSRYIVNNSQKRNMNDSLILYLNTPDPNQYGQRIYFFGRHLTRTFNFFPADRTIKQLKNSGGLRLIRNQQASDSIMAYDHAVERILLTQNRQENELFEIWRLTGRLMNANILETMLEGGGIIPPAGNPPLRTVNREFILDFIYAIHQIKGSIAVNMEELRRLKEKATGTIRFLKNEYKIE